MNIFNQKIAVITGAGSGIGRGLARVPARRGARVGISDISHITDVWRTWPVLRTRKNL